MSNSSGTENDSESREGEMMPTEDDLRISTPFKENGRLLENNLCLSPDIIDGEIIEPPPSSLNEESSPGPTSSSSLTTKQMKELLMAKLSAIAEEVVITGRNTESPQGTMVKALDDSCVLFAVDNNSQDIVSSSPPEKQLEHVSYFGVLLLNHFS